MALQHGDDDRIRAPRAAEDRENGPAIRTRVGHGKRIEPGRRTLVDQEVMRALGLKHLTEQGEGLL